MTTYCANCLKPALDTVIRPSAQKMEVKKRTPVPMPDISTSAGRYQVQAPNMDSNNEFWRLEGYAPPICNEACVILEIPAPAWDCNKSSGVYLCQAIKFASSN